MKQTIVLDSHQLSLFQRCPRLYFYSELARRGTARFKTALVKGTVLHNILDIYYKAKIRGIPFEKNVETIINSLPELTKDLTAQEKQLVVPRLLQYFPYYQHETWKPIGAEIGFSKIIYEDENYLFVYEGKIDLLMEVQGVRSFVDHKSQIRHSDLPHESNQFIGYAWATGFKMGIINFLNLSQSKAPRDAFRREIMNFTDNIIAEWKEGVIEDFFTLARLLQDKPTELFPILPTFRKKRQGCDGKYGMCDFIEVCKQTNPSVIQGKLDKEFIEKDKWSPWEI